LLPFFGYRDIKGAILCYNTMAKSVSAGKVGKTMREPIYVTRPFLPPRAEFEHELDQIWERDYLTNNGPELLRFQTELQHFFDAPQVDLFVNGHQALDVAIKGLGLSGEVITTPFTFASTTHALVLNGIRPVFCDVRAQDLTMDPAGIEQLITPRTTAILPVHVYGHPCDTVAIEAIARRHGLKVLYDAAHTFGVTVNGKSLALAGDVSMLSFHATKLFHSIEGGALVYRDESLTRIFNAYKNFGIEGEEHVDYVGGNAKMNEFQAAMGLCNLPFVPQLIAERKEITSCYREYLADVPGITMFYPDREPGVGYNYAYLPILIDAEKFGKSRDAVYESLKKENIYTRRYFYPIVPDFGCYRAEHGNDVLPVARRAGKEVLCLPIYNGLARADVEQICTWIRGW
jgi:dTDP-4-amino-4,6-dideoxygalactose transaminase